MATYTHTDVHAAEVVRPTVPDLDFPEATSLDRHDSWWAGALVSGFVGGLAMAGYLALAFWLGGIGFWRPLQLIGAVSPSFQPPGYGFHFWPVVLGFVVHMATAGLLGLLYGSLVRGSPRLSHDGGSELFLGLAFGIAAWLVSGLWLGPLVDPFLRYFSPGHWFFGHALFGIGTGLTFYALLHDPHRHEAHHHEPPLGMTPV